MCTSIRANLATRRMLEAEETELGFEPKLNVDIRTRARTLTFPATAVSVHFAALTHLAHVRFSLDEFLCISKLGFCVCVITEIDVIRISSEVVLLHVNIS